MHSFSFQHFLCLVTNVSSKGIPNKKPVEKAGVWKELVQPILDNVIIELKETRVLSTQASYDSLLLSKWNATSPKFNQLWAIIRVWGIIPTNYFRLGYNSSMGLNSSRGYNSREYGSSYFLKTKDNFLAKTGVTTYSKVPNKRTLSSF